VTGRPVRGVAPLPPLSVLIPALNEAAALPALLQDLAAQTRVRVEVIVADGGSGDATAAVARRHGATVITAARGRAAQLNAAVATAQGPWLCCLHADSRLPDRDQLAQALACLQREYRPGEIVAGHWPLLFVRSQPGHDALFRQLEAKSASNRPGTVNGDQGLLIHRDTLAALGGFDASLPFFEDQRIASKVFAQGRFLQLPGVLLTSARRFEVEGHAPRLALMALIVGAEAAGLDDWLATLPGLYREQAAASDLRPGPFIENLLEFIARLPEPRRRSVWRKAGRLVASQAWQLALLLDTRQGDERRWLPRFDAVMAPIFDTRAAASVMSAALPLALQVLAVRFRARS